MTKRKTYTVAFKAKVVLELLRDEKPLAQVAAQYEVHPSQLRKWKQLAVQHLPSLFADSQQDQGQHPLNVIQQTRGVLKSALAAGKAPGAETIMPLQPPAAAAASGSSHVAGPGDRHKPTRNRGCGGHLT